MKKISEAIVILGGGLKKDKNGWRTTNFDESDNFGAMGDRLRVLAGFYLYKKFVKTNPEILVVVSGGKGQLKDVLPGKITLASIIKKELIKIGIPAKNIIIEEKSGNTYQQLKELNKLATQLNLFNIIVISNRYHLSRIRAMIEYGKGLFNLRKILLNKNFILKSAEEIVLAHDLLHWKNIINKAYQSKSMKKRIQLEKQGVNQIRSGTYQWK